MSRKIFSSVNTQVGTEDWRRLKTHTALDPTLCQVKLAGLGRGLGVVLPKTMLVDSGFSRRSSRLILPGIQTCINSKLPTYFLLIYLLTL